MVSLGKVQDPVYREAEPLAHPPGDAQADFGEALPGPGQPGVHREGQPAVQVLTAFRGVVA